MSGHDLIEGLKGTGTGERKLEAAREYLRRHPGANAGALMVEMARKGAWPDGTLLKAQELIGGTYAPPPPFKPEQEGEVRSLLTPNVESDDRPGIRPVPVSTPAAPAPAK